MFENFVASFPPDALDVSVPYRDSRLNDISEYGELIRMGSGVSFGSGILRVHSGEGVPRVKALIRQMFPEYVDIVPVAKDWLGRQFVLDFANVGSGSPRLLLFEPGSAEVFDVGCGIERLFDCEMVADSVTFLASDLFAQWCGDGRASPSAGQCVGFKVPLFLGGLGSVDNLEISDENVYWSLLGQLRANLM